MKDKHDIDICMDWASTGGCLTTLKVDGIDLSMKTTEIIFRHKGGERPRLFVEFVPEHLEIQAIGSVTKKRLL